MLRIYIKEILVSLRRTPSITVINIFGMSVSVAIFILIALYIKSELSVNRDNPAYDRIYRIARGDGTGYNGLPARVGELLVDNIPGVISFLRVDHAGSNHIISVDEKPHMLGKMAYVDSTMFRFFPIPFKYGDCINCLNEKFSIVLSESLSVELFGDKDPVGKLVRLDEKFDVRVTGVFNDKDNTTHFDVAGYISFPSYGDINNWPDFYDCWGCFNYTCYLMLEENTGIDLVRKQVNDYLHSFGKEQGNKTFVINDFALTNLYDVYFGREIKPEFRKGNERQLKILAAIASIILIIAIINYVNLATAVGGERLRQLALRKVLGAQRIFLFLTIIGESVLVSLLSVNTGLILAELFKPLFSSIFNADLMIGYLANPWVIACLIIFGILLGVLAGLYPALVITGANKRRTLYIHDTESLSGGRLRSILITIQVLVSTALIGCTIVIYGQLRYIDRADLGFDKEALLYMPLNIELRNHLDAFRDELIKYPGIENVSYSYASFRTSNVRWNFRHTDNRQLTFHVEGGDEFYLETLGLELVKGRNFRGPQDLNMIIVNEQAEREYFSGDAIGQKVNGLGKNAQIIGVVRDFKFQTFEHDVEPLAIKFNPQWRHICNVRLSGTDIVASVRYIEKTWKAFNTKYPFTYKFVDQLYSERYEKEKKTGDLLLFITIASILISCLGIYGLSAFSVMKKAREVAIRKVNGSGIYEIVKLLLGNINRLVAIAALPAALIIFIVMRRWLSDFVFHISIPWWVYLVSVLLVWFVALLSTAGLTLKTATENPAEVLRIE